MEQIAIRAMLDDLLISLEQYLERSLPHMKIIADRFYIQTDKRPWEELAQVSEALQWIFQVYQSLENAQSSGFQYLKWGLIQAEMGKLSGQIAALEDASSTQDLSMVGDIIHYEIIPILSEIHKQTLTIIDNEVLRHDAN